MQTHTDKQEQCS